MNGRIVDNFMTMRREYYDLYGKPLGHVGFDILDSGIFNLKTGKELKRHNEMVGSVKNERV